MFETDYPVLCGGTFFTLIMEERKPGTSGRSHVSGIKNNFLEKDMLKSLAKIVSPELEKDISASSCSEFKSCKKSFFTVTGINPRSQCCEAFNERVKTQYAAVLDDMEKFVKNYISAESCAQTRCTKRLLDLICKDDSIQENEIFYIDEYGNGQALKQIALARDKLDINFPAFLLGIWHFVVVHRADNTIGAATFESWHKRESSANSKSRKVFISTIGDCYNREICIHTSPERFEGVDSGDFDPSESGSDDSASQSGTPNDASIRIPQIEAAEIAYPQECRICCCCKDWLGSLGRACMSLDGRYGECDALGKRTLSTASCDLFRADHGKISQYQVYSHIPRSWKR